MKIIIFVVMAQLEPKSTNNGNGQKKSAAKITKFMIFVVVQYTGKNISYEIHNFCLCTK